MTQKTELSAPDTRPELSNAYLGSLAVATLIVLILVFGSPLVASNPLAPFHIEGVGTIPFFYPWVVAAGQTIANGLSEFSGQPPSLVAWPLRTEMLLNLLILGIIVPTLTLLLMGKRSGAGASAPARGLYLVSLIITTTFAVSMLPSGYLVHRVKVSMRESQAVQTNKDNIINDLNIIAWKIREYRILPKALGGGEGKTEGFVLPASVVKTDDATYTSETGPFPSSMNGVAAVAKLHASSKKYPGCEVDVTLLMNGNLWDWTYKGQFQ
jgi:hypothetical protein